MNNFKYVLSGTIRQILSLNVVNFRGLFLKWISLIYSGLLTIKGRDQYDQYFDYLEIRFLRDILDSRANGFDTNALNTFLKSSELSQETQRQRRHLFLKELNYKLFLITNLRESIVRVSSEADKRMKFYSLLNEAKSNEILVSLFSSGEA